MRTAFILPLALMLGGQALAADQPKHRSSSPAGIDVRDAVASRQTYAPSTAVATQPADRQAGVAGGSGGGASDAQGGGAVVQGGPGSVRIDGNTSTSAAGVGLNTTVSGQRTRGCVTVGGIAGGGC